MRDTFRDQAYWEWLVDSYERAIETKEQTAVAPATTPLHRRRLRYALYKERLELLSAYYSRGDAIDALQTAFPAVVQARETYYAEPDHEPLNMRILDKYVQSLWLLAWAILLQVPSDMAQRVVTTINQTGVDALFDTLVERVTPGVARTDVLLHPKPYAPLYEATLPTTTNRNQLVTQFLTRYYTSMRTAYWHDLHLLPKAGFFGYWCVELAAVVQITGMDDQAFRANPYYPSDLPRWSER
jgi:hypothetical protein